MSVLGHGVEICTSTTRPTPISGSLIYETDTQKMMLWDGSSWVTPMNLQAAGGSLTGTYPNPTVNQYAVRQSLQAQSTQITVSSTAWTNIVTQNITTTKNNSKLLVLFTADCNALATSAWKRIGIFLDSTLQYYVISATYDSQYQEVVHMSSLITVPTISTVTVAVKAQQGNANSNFGEEGGNHKNNLIVLELI